MGGVYKILTKDGYTVSVVQNPTISLAKDVAATKRIVAVQNGPVVLVGHSYGGAVITEAGNRRARQCLRYCLRRTAIYYSTRQSSPPHSRVMWTKKEPRSWQTPKSHGAWTHSAARSASRLRRPSRAGTWLPPVAQRFMSKRAGSTVVEVAGSHAIYVSQPNAVAELIEKAAREVKAVAD